MKVKLLMAMTLDGKIARNSDHFPDWTGPEDKKLFVKLTKEAGVLIMGSRTYDTIGKPLPGRLNVVMTRDSGRETKEPELLITTKSPEEILTVLESKGFKEVILAGGTQINSLFLSEGLIDEVHVTISPLIFGEGLGLFGEKLTCDLQLQSCETIGDNLVYAIYDVLK